MSRTTRLLAFTAPALAFYSLFVLWPMLCGFRYSLYDWNGLSRDPRFVGAANFIEAFTEDPDFIHSILFTARLVAVLVVAQNAIALGLAVLVESRRRSKDFFRTMLFLPNMISMIVGGFMWMFIFSRILPRLGRWPSLVILDQTWIGDPRFSFWAIATVSAWGGVGYLMVIYIAALQGVPEWLKDAAAMDGAGPFLEFFHVTLPVVLPSLTIGIFITLNNSFKIFDPVYALTGGGPGRATQVVALNIFEEAFDMSNRYGYASAKSLILFAIVLAITLLQLAAMKKRELEA